MAAKDPELRKAYGRAGGLIAHGTPAQARTAKQELAELRITSYIRKVVATFPPITTEQRDRIIALLAVEDGGGRAA